MYRVSDPVPDVEQWTPGQLLANRENKLEWYTDERHEAVHITLPDGMLGKVVILDKFAHLVKFVREESFEGCWEVRARSSIGSRQGRERLFKIGATKMAIVPACLGVLQGNSDFCQLLLALRGLNREWDRQVGLDLGCHFTFHLEGNFGLDLLRNLLTHMLSNLDLQSVPN